MTPAILEQLTKITLILASQTKPRFNFDLLEELIHINISLISTTLGTNDATSKLHILINQLNEVKFNLRYSTLKTIQDTIHELMISQKELNDITTNISQTALTLSNISDLGQLNPLLINLFELCDLTAILNNRLSNSLNYMTCLNPISELLSSKNSSPHYLQHYLKNL